MVKIAILGYGTIGSGVAEVIRINKKLIEQRINNQLEIKYILDLRDFPGDANEDKIVHDYNIIVQDPEIQIVVEAMGGVEPAYTFALQAVRAGKHFVTSNKALMADKGPELIEESKNHNVNVLFEASVGGGIPIIRPINTCLTAEDILEITGILNGTTNFMLTKMAEDGSEFDDVLKTAQEKGYAEADPTADIEGYDACRKIAILTSLASGRHVDYRDIHTEGITKITARDIRYAKAMNRKIKLLATSRKMDDGTYCVMVAPFLLKEDHPLAPVSGVFNAVFVRGNTLGDSMFYGAGAGSLPTASAVVADVIDCAKHLDKHVWMTWSTERLMLKDASKLACEYFVRAKANEDAVEDAFGSVDYVKVPGIDDELAFVTGIMDGKAYQTAADKLGGVVNMIRLN